VSEHIVYIKDGLVKYDDYGRLLDKCEKLIKENKSLNNIIDKTNWYLKQMLVQVENKETKAIINGALDLLLKEGDKE